MNTTLKDCRDAAEAAAVFDGALRDAVLPFWAAEGADPVGGFCWEQLDPAGRPRRDAPRRLMVQARQAAAFADAVRTGCRSPAVGEAAPQISDLVLALFSGGVDLARGLASSTDGDGCVTDETRDACAFSLFALAPPGRARDPLARALGRLSRVVLGRPFAGGWVDRRDEQGAPTADIAPASNLYHLHGAWAERATQGLPGWVGQARAEDTACPA